MRFWEPETGEELQPIETVDVAEAFAVSKSGKIVAVSNGASLVRIFERATRTPIATIDNDADVDFMLLVSDELLVTSGLDGRLRLHNIPEDPVVRFRGHANRALAVAFSPDGERIAGLGYEAIHVWEAATGKPITTIPSYPRTAVVRIAFSPDGTKLLGGHDFEAMMWDIESGLRLALIDGDRNIGGLAWDPTGARVAVVDRGQSRPATEAWLLISDIATDRVVARYPIEDQIADITYSPDGDLIAMAGPNSVGVLDLETGKLAWSAAANDVRDVEFSPSGALVTASSQTGFLRVWKSRTGEVHRTLRLPSPNALGVGFVSEERLVSGADEGLVHVWDIESGERAGALRGHVGNIMYLEASAVTRSVVALSRAGNISVWRVPEESRGPDELAALIDERVPFHLDGIDIVYR